MGLLSRYDVKMGLRILKTHPSLVFSILRGRAAFARDHMKLELKKCEEVPLPSYIDDLPRYASQFCSPLSHLYALCRMVKPNIVVETGVHYGNSSSYILKALSDNGMGELHSIDLPEADVGVRDYILPSKMPTGFLIPDSLRSRWKLTLGDAKVELPKLLQKLGTIDIFLHDSLHTYEHMTFEFEAAWKHIRPGGFLVSDDVDYNPAFSEFCKRNGVTGLTLSSEGVVQKS